VTPEDAKDTTIVCTTEGSILGTATGWTALSASPHCEWLKTVQCAACLSGFAQPKNSKKSCDQCQAGKYAGGSGFQQCAVCPPGQYANKPTEATGCIEAPTNLNDGAVCKEGKFVYANGFWHDGIDLDTYAHREGFQLETQSSFYSCPGGPASCLVNPTSGAITCQGGSTGVLCAVCKKGYKFASDGSCATCSS
jgi:hypothetical protein